MKSTTFVRRVALSVSAEEAFAWHERPGALERLVPPWEDIRVVERTGGIRDGGRVTISLPVGPLRVRWVAEHRDYEPGRRFRDVQVRGPFRHWEHEHRFKPAGPDRCELEDRIEYALPGGPLGRLVGSGSIRRKLEATFRYRHETTAADLALHARYADRAPLVVAVTGSSGLVGSTLVPLLSTGGHEVRRVVRRETGPGQDRIAWDPATGEVEAAKLEGIDAMVHLAGESLAGGRWTAARKTRIEGSRVDATRKLSESLAKLARPPKVLVSAAAIGFYGSRGEEVLDEESPPGEGFLAEVCRGWEAATEPAAEAGIRVVNLRLGIVTSPRGGALAKMLLPFRLGAGGRLGDGRHYWSWIGPDDVAASILHAIRTESLAGPVNAVAPEPVSNRQFTRTLAWVLRRPAVAPVPKPALRLAFGEMADEMMLTSAQVVPGKLEAAGFTFRQPKLEGALRSVLGRY